MSVSLAPVPILQIFNNAGAPNAGGSILTQVGGVNYPTYQDSAGTVPLPNPIPLNSRGEVSNATGNSCQLFLTNGVVYVFTYFDANGNQIDQAQYVTPSGATATSIGTALYPILAAEGATVVNIQYNYGVPERYGCSTALADNSAFMQNCFNAGFEVNGSGKVYPIGSPLTTSTPNQIFEDFGLQANSSFPLGGTMMTLGLAATSAIARNLYFDGGIATGGNSNIAAIGLDVQAGRARLYQIIGNHISSHLVAFDSTGSGDSGISGYQLQQWNNSDPGWAIQANYTADAIYFNRPDCFAIAGEGSFARWCKYPYHFGSSAATCWVHASHPYNGSYAGNSFGAPAQTDAVLCRIDEGAHGLNLLGNYWDSGHIDCYSSDLQFIHGLPLQSSSTTVFSVDPGQASPNWIRLYATGKGYPYDLNLDLPNKYLASSNSPASALPTSFIGFYPSPPLTLLSISGNGTTASATFAAVPFAPQVNSTFFLAGVTPSGFNNSVVATALVQGTQYQITSLGTTDFTLVGAPVNSIGTIFIANATAGLGTGTAAQAYTVQSATQTSVTFLCSTNATGSGGTLQRSFSGNTAGFDQSQGLLGNSNNMRVRINGGDFHLCTNNGVNPANVQASTSLYFTEIRQAGNAFPTTWQFGNQAGSYPYASVTSGYFNVIAANSPGSAIYPAARISMNLNGTATGDDGSTHGVWQAFTQAGARVSLDGYSGGVQSMYPNSTNYLSLGKSGNIWTAVYATNTTIQTSDGREKTDVTPSDLGLNFIRKLNPVSYRWIKGATHVKHGEYVLASTGEKVDFNPKANHDAQQALIAKLRTYPSRKDMTAAQEAAYGADEAALNALAKLAHSVTRTPELETHSPGKRTHYGLIAQEVKAVLDEMKVKDFGGWNLMDKNDPNSQQALGYGEFIAPLIKAVQELAARLDALEKP